MLPLRIAAGAGMAMSSGVIIDLDKIRAIRLSVMERERQRLEHWRSMRMLIGCCLLAGCAVYGTGIWLIFR